MRTKRYKRNVESTSYDLSISDMMAALCCVFVLICVTVMVRLTEQKAEFQRQNKKAKAGAKAPAFWFIPPLRAYSR